MILAFHIKVFGTVQGVGFRYYTKLKADELYINGHVKNISDGTVEILAQGKQEAVYKFLEWCHQGPSTSFVSKLEYEKVDKENQLEKFDILR